MKYFKMGWFDAAWLLGLAALGVYSVVNSDWISTGIDFGALLLLWPLIVIQKRQRDKEKANLRSWTDAFGTLAEGGEVTLKKIEGGYEPVETPVEE